MQTNFGRRPATAKRRRTTRIALALSAAAFGLVASADAQPLDSQPPRAAAHEDSPRRARTVRPERSSWAHEAKRDYAGDGAMFAEEQIDTAFLETRIRDLSAKVRELNDLLQQQKEAAEPVHFMARPMRITLLERDRPLRVAKTYGEALEVVVRERARAIGLSFNDAEERTHLAFDPDAAEVHRLLQPVYAWLAATGTAEEITHAHLRALVYATLLEARAKIDRPEPMPAVHKMLRDLHLDRTALTAHLRRSFLLDQPALGQDLGAVLAATATMYPDPPSVRDFLVWLAEGVSADLQDELLRKAAYPYRGDTEGQFEAAAENATADNGDVLKLQVELQRLLAEAKTLRAANRVGERTAGDWEHRLLQAERALDHLLRAADSEREGVMTLARRVPIVREPMAVALPSVESLPIEPAEEVASDGLNTQH